MLKKDILIQLVDIFNLSFSSGIYPTPLKTAKVIPIHKKDSKLECSNYRPIALLSNIDKILEKLMHKRLSNFLDKNKLIYSLQFGFRQNYSISYALIHLTETIKQNNLLIKVYLVVLFLLISKKLLTHFAWQIRTLWNKRNY